MSNQSINYEKLLPAQRSAVDALVKSVAQESVAEFIGRPGAGKSTILRVLHEQLGGVLLTSREFIEASAKNDPLALDETAYAVIAAALGENETVLVDDFHYISMVSCCSQAYPRQNLLPAALVPLVQVARDQGKRLIIGSEGMPVAGLHSRVPAVPIPAFTVEDYSILCAAYLDEAKLAAIDMKKIHRFAPKLNARQLRDTCVDLQRKEALDT